MKWKLFLLSVISVSVLGLATVVGIGCKHPTGISDCAPWCSADHVGDGICDNACDVADCNYDGGDCSSPGGTMPTHTPVQTTSMPSTPVTQGCTNPMVIAGCWYTIGLKSDGTVVYRGYKDVINENITGWNGIVSVSADTMGDNQFNTLGLKSDGTVVTSVITLPSQDISYRFDESWTSVDSYGVLPIEGWTSIVQVAAGEFHAVGLKSDGTVVSVGNNDWGQCNTGDWKDITQVAASWLHTVGLKSDGTVVATGQNGGGVLDVGEWKDIVQVSTCYEQTLGLKSEGTVVAVGSNSYGQLDVEGWRDIVQVSAGQYFSVGLKSDGTVVVAPADELNFQDVGDWTGIIQVSAGQNHIVGLKSDGTVVAAGDDRYSQSDLDDWNLGTACSTPAPVQ